MGKYDGHILGMNSGIRWGVWGIVRGIRYWMDANIGFWVLGIGYWVVGILAYLTNGGLFSPPDGDGSGSMHPIPPHPPPSIVIDYIGDKLEELRLVYAIYK